MMCSDFTTGNHCFLLCINTLVNVYVAFPVFSHVAGTSYAYFMEYNYIYQCDRGSMIAAHVHSLSVVATILRTEADDYSG